MRVKMDKEITFKNITLYKGGEGRENIEQWKSEGIILKSSSYMSNSVTAEYKLKESDEGTRMCSFTILYKRRKRMQERAEKWDVKKT